MLVSPTFFQVKRKSNEGLKSSKSDEVALAICEAFVNVKTA